MPTPARPATRTPSLVNRPKWRPQPPPRSARPVTPRPAGRRPPRPRDPGGPGPPPPRPSPGGRHSGRLVLDAGGGAQLRPHGDLGAVGAPDPVPGRPARNAAPDRRHVRGDGDGHV